VNVVLQFFLINNFLNGEFLLFGTNFVEYLLNSEVFGGTETGLSNPTNMVFPKVSSCTFRTYGTSGHLQDIHAICILPLNILNEKIYTLLWFWYVFLAAISALAVAYRVLYSCAVKALIK
jgi:hypothetical protein